MYKHILITAVIATLLFSCGRTAYEGKIVAVESSNLILIDLDKPGSNPRIITGNFASACSPALSHDAKYLFFQAKQEAGSPWQIWLMDLRKEEFRAVTSLKDNCTQPAPLPDGSIIFSREIEDYSSQIKSLYRINMDGCCLKRLTFKPSVDKNASVIQEGRVIFTSAPSNSETGPAKMMIMRPDGTKAEIYHNSASGNQPISKAVESKEMEIYLIESGGVLCRLNHRRPLHSSELLFQKSPGHFSAVSPWEGGHLLASYSSAADEPLALYMIDPKTESAPELLYMGEGDISDPLWVVSKEERPRILPSAVNLEQPMAQLMSQNINHSMLPARKGLIGDSIATSIRISGINGVISELDVESDGSFYLKLRSDTPYRFETLNELGELVRGPSDWIYLRPNERRACVGCHADPELAPENFQPLAVKTAPHDLSKIHSVETP